MFRKFALITISIFLLAFNANAGSDGELILKKNQPAEVKDCFENLNRATFAFNQALDGIVFNATPIDVSIKGDLVDGRPHTIEGKIIAKLQAFEQFKLYTNE